MESDAALQGDASNGAEVSGSENQQETPADMSENNVTSAETSAATDSDGGPLDSSNALSLEPDSLGPAAADVHDIEQDCDKFTVKERGILGKTHQYLGKMGKYAKHYKDEWETLPEFCSSEDEMDIDDTTGAADASNYIGDNCLSTSATDNSPQEQDQLEPLMKEHLEDLEGGECHDESPDQSLNTPLPHSGLADPPEVDDDGSSTMDEDGGEGVASSDDINEISSAAPDPIGTAISSSTAEAGMDISSSGEPRTGLITSSNATLSFSFLQRSNEFGDADTSDAGSTDAMPSVSEALPILSMSANGSALLSPNVLQGDEANTRVSSSVAQAADADGVSSSGASSDAAHALATLASAALHHHEQAEPEDPKPLTEEDTWYTVGIVKGSTFTVQNYITDPNVDLSNLSLETLPDLTGYATTPLEHGTAYKFRIAAINSCGRGDFSEESAFKTCLPGYPGAPSAIKISKSVEGAHLSWEPPQVAAEGIFEYSVYLAVRSNTQPKEAPKSQLAFVRVYCGKANTCIVPQSSLSAAHVDSSTKPAIIFRIAARNEKGYGPATQVRWLQDLKSTGVKRAGEGRLQGASPVKQAKQAIH